MATRFPSPWNPWWHRGALALALVALGCGGKDDDDHSRPVHHVAGTLQIHRFTAEPPAIHPGKPTRLTAEFSMGHAVIEPDVGTVVSGFPVEVCPTKDTTYTLTVTLDKNKVVKRSLTVKVVPLENPAALR